MGSFEASSWIKNEFKLSITLSLCEICFHKFIYDFMEELYRKCFLSAFEVFEHLLNYMCVYYNYEKYVISVISNIES